MGMPVRAISGPELRKRWDRPPIALVDPETGQKIKLKLRTMSFAREVHALPVDMLEVHEILIKHRADRNASIYMMVAAWNKLRVHDRYWTSFQFATEDEYLAYYGLPEGMTLAGWTVMVNLFDKATFVLLGDEVLSFMIRSVGQYQTETDERKKDYQEIFDTYCRVHESFDKTAFYRIVSDVLRKKYELPLAKEEGLSHKEWQKKSLVEKRGVKKHRKVVDVEGSQKFGPRLSQDFTWVEQECPHCKAKLDRIELYKSYIKKLVKVIVESLGKRRLPKCPDELSDN